MEKYLYSKMSLSDIYNRLSKAEEPPREDKEKIVWLDNDHPIENPQKQMLLEKLTQYHASAARPFEMLSSHMYGNHVYDLGDPEETKEINYQHFANALTAHIKHRNTIEDKMDDDEVQEALEKPIGQFAVKQWCPANIPAHVMGIKVASHVLGKGHPDISKVGHGATFAGFEYLSDLEEQGETFSPEKHLAPLHQTMLNACAEGAPHIVTGKPLVYSAPPKPGSLGALKQKAPDISKSYKSNKNWFYQTHPLKSFAKGLGENARNKFISRSANELNERYFPTGEMIPMENEDFMGFGLTVHKGVFGEKRHIRVDVSSSPGADATSVDWIHILPGTKVEPHHVQQIFEALHTAGYTKPVKWKAIPDDDESGLAWARRYKPSRRDRLFRPLAAQWKEFIAAQQGESTKSKQSESTVQKSDALKQKRNNKMVLNKNWFYQVHPLVKKSFNNTSSLLEKSRYNFSNGSTPENFIAPGGEFFFTPEARRMYLEAAYGDAAKAQRLMQTALNQHNALWLKDQQPRGLGGIVLPVPQKKRDPENPSIYDSRNRGLDPIALISEFNRKENWPLHEGENQDQANARMDELRREQLPKAIEKFTDPHEVKTDPQTLRNSFANQDAFNNIPLHVLYNQLSKSYKTAAWQRAEGQNPKGGLNAKGRASARAEGHNLKPPVKSGDNPRRASFLARMGNSPGPEYDEHGKPTRLLLSLQAWGASSKADARRKAKAISARLEMNK